MRALSAFVAVMLVSAVTLIAPEGPIVASSECGAEPHDPAGRHIDHDGDCRCDDEGAPGGHDCDGGSHASCTHTHVPAIALLLASIPSVPVAFARDAHVIVVRGGEREGYRTIPSRPPSA